MGERCERVKKRKTERNKEKQGVIVRGRTSEDRFMFPIRRLRSQHVAYGKWDVTWGVHRFKIISPLSLTKGFESSKRLKTLENIDVDECTEMGKIHVKANWGKS